MYMGVLCCFALFVCLTLLASFFLPSHLSLKTCMYFQSTILLFSTVHITRTFVFVVKAHVHSIFFQGYHRSCDSTVVNTGSHGNR